MDSTVLTHSKAVDDEVMEQYEAITSSIRPERRMEAIIGNTRCVCVPVCLYVCVSACACVCLF